eukprot:s2442_g12.t1
MVRSVRKGAKKQGGSQVKKSISKKNKAATSSDEVKEGATPSRSTKKSTKVKEASKTQASDAELSAAARRLSCWADDAQRTQRWLASRGALEEPLVEAKGQILRFRDYLPLEMADNVLAILESLPEEAWQLSHHQNDKGAASHRFWSADVMDIPELSPLRSVFWKMLPELRGEPTLPIFSCGRYGASDFIGRHDDQALVPFFDDTTIYSRTVAAIWYLTKEWSEAEGGCLIDLGDQVKEKQLVPIYNSLVVFEVPHWHAVSAVTSDRWRYSIFGWWHQKGDRRPSTEGTCICQALMTDNAIGCDVETANPAHESKSLEAKFCRQEFAIMSWTVAINHATVTTPILYASSVLTNANGQAGNAMLYGSTLICSLFFSTLIFGVVGSKKGLTLSMGLYSVYVLLFAVAAELCDQRNESNGACIVGNTYQLPVNLAGPSRPLEPMVEAEECIELLENGERSEDSDSSEEGNCRGSSWADWFWWLLQFVLDLAASVPFWYAMFSEFPDRVVYGVLVQQFLVLIGFLAILGLLMILWRIYRAYCEEKTELGQSIPYTCAHAHADGRDLFLVATAILQAITFRAPAEGAEPAVEISTYAQRAVWNTQAANEEMCGEVVFSPEDEYGQALDAFEDVEVETEDFMALIRKPPKEMLEQQLAPFTTKAYQDGA